MAEVGLVKFAGYALAMAKRVIPPLCVYTCETTLTYNLV